MKKCLSIVFIALSILIMSGCSEDDSNPTSSSGNAQFSLVWIDEYEGTDKAKQEYYYDLDVDGVVMGDPIPKINYFKVNSTTYSNEDNFFYYPGYAGFGMTYLQEQYFSIGSNADFELNTDLGTLAGTITKPTEVHNIKVNGITMDYNSWPNATIDPYEDFVISWTYESQKPDFIVIWADYDWYNKDGTKGEIERRIIVPSTQNYATLFEDYELTSNGSVWFDLEIYNGPNPELNESGNLSGTGAGYMYWSYYNEEMDGYVDVGTGYKSESKLDKAVLRLERKEAFRKELIKKLRD